MFVINDRLFFFISNVFNFDTLMDKDLDISSSAQTMNKMKCEHWQDSNPGPFDYKACRLTTTLAKLQILGRKV